ncbi:MAG: acetate--CoA ligase family protein [Thermoleophilia bacterium]|nr:acetate--CoA ligase family protein [Thermoleophilia bacterium]
MMVTKEARLAPATTLLCEVEAATLLRDYGIAYPEHGLAATAAEAVVVAGRLGYPVVMKLISPDVVHKSDVGGVLVGLADGPMVERGFQKILDAVSTHVPDARVVGMLVCRQAPPGTEVIVGGFQEPVFGPAVCVGLGGVWAEVLHDVVFRVAPVDPIDAREMLRELVAYPVLRGARGASPCDLEALEGLVAAVSRVIAERPDIMELDLNPVRLFETGALALDARVLLSNSARAHAFSTGGGT